MPAANQPPIGLTDQEILSVIAALQALGGTPTVTLKTTHRYYGGAAEPGGLPEPPADPTAPGEAQPLPRKGTQLRLADPSPDVTTNVRSFAARVRIQPSVAHQAPALDGVVTP
jgi:hypothetical protein